MGIIAFWSKGGEEPLWERNLLRDPPRSGGDTPKAPDGAIVEAPNRI
ncbi:hypothetical protein [Halomonas urmiana]|nr:hypothetical protein [Halomonas urmiana]